MYEMEEVPQISYIKDIPNHRGWYQGDLFYSWHGMEWEESG
jgi:hypothetical protein